MKKIKLLTIITILTMSLGIQKTHGQAAILALIFGDKVASEDFNLSLELGWNLTSVSDFSNNKRSSATNFGLGLNFKLSEKFYLSPTVFFLSDREFNFDSESLNTGNSNLDNEFVNTGGTGTLSYIDVPVLMWYQIDKIRIGVGPQISFLQKSRLIFNGDDGDLTQKISGKTNDIDYGVMASVGYELGTVRKGKGLFVQLRYYHGFEDIYNDKISTANNRSSYFAVHFSLPFVTDKLAKQNLENIEEEKQRKEKKKNK